MITTNKLTAKIYIITSPSGKQYIGKTTKSIDKILNDYNNLSKTNRSSLLVNEFKIYKYTNFKIETLIECNNKDHMKYKIYFIDQYNTFEPNGLNASLQKTINNIPEDVRKKMSEAHKTYYKNLTEKRVVSEETKQKISNTLIEKTVRYDHNGNQLPKYMKYLNQKNRKGYQVISHPECKQRSFISSGKSLDQLYDDCLKFLNILSIN